MFSITALPYIFNDDNKVVFFDTVVYPLTSNVLNNVFYDIMLLNLIHLITRIKLKYWLISDNVVNPDTFNDVAWLDNVVKPIIFNESNITKFESLFCFVTYL